jgi:hypothetical protein
MQHRPVRPPAILASLAAAVVIAAALTSCDEPESARARRAEAREAEADRAARRAACRAVMAANAALLIRCQEPLVAEAFGSEAGFRARLELLCETPDLLRAASPARMAAECPAAVARLTCDEWYAAERLPPECTSTGSLPDGAPCALDDQCAGGRCELPEGQACGVCARWGTEGEPCVSDSCGRGLVCANGACARKAPLGGPCSFSLPCQGHLRCQKGTCVPRGREGDWCSTHEDCNPHLALVCSRSICTRPIAGDRCLPRPGDGRVLICAGQAKCNEVTGECDPPLPDGAPCGLQPDRCRWPATCTAGVCQAPRAPVCE